MAIRTTKKRIAILGGGPSGLFIYKRLVESKDSALEISIFEKKNKLGMGMPYSKNGANREHITNVSPNEIPEMAKSVAEWIAQAPAALLDRFNIQRNHFNEYKVLPRLLFGEYLSDQFNLLLKQAEKKGIATTVHLETAVEDLAFNNEQGTISVILDSNSAMEFDHVVVCTGHVWPQRHEGKIKGYFDSPYPPAKLELSLNHPVAIKGASLTAIDAVRTLARKNGSFETDDNGFVSYHLGKGSENFKIIMHSRSGLLPAVRIHLDSTHLKSDALLTPQEMETHRLINDGFISLDYIFEKDFKAQIQLKDPNFYDEIKDLGLEQFVEKMMSRRENVPAFELLKQEYKQAEKSIHEKKPIYWKEMLAVLSAALNPPAKYFSAEDMLRLKQNLMPLISIIIAFVPQSSCKELLALYDAKVIDLVGVGEEGEFEANENEGATYRYKDANGKMKETSYQTFVDCVGQAHLPFDDFPFKTLIEQGAISPARLQFKNQDSALELLNDHTKDIEKVGEHYFLNVPGIAISDSYEVVARNGKTGNELFIMAVPYMGGFNPDYSGLDFCEAASLKIASRLLMEE